MEHDPLNKLLDIFYDAQSFKYVLLADDFTALGYVAAHVDNYRQVTYAVTQVNAIIDYLNDVISSQEYDKWEVAKDGKGGYYIIC